MELLAEKLKKQREFLKISQADAANSIGYKNYQTLLYYENGTRLPSILDLKKLSDLYHKEINYFLNDEEPITVVPKIMWRKKPASSIARKTTAELINFAENYMLLEQLLGESPAKIFDNTKNQVSNTSDCLKLADKFSSKTKLGPRPAKILKNIIEDKLSIKVIELPLGDQNCSGATTLYKNQFIILLNLNDKPWRKNFSLAHELFHILTWDTANKIPENKIEKFADIFASNILLPTKEISEEFNSICIKKYFNSSDLIGMAIEFNVSLQAMVYKILNLHFISKHTAQKILENLNQSELKKKKYDIYSDLKIKTSSRFESLAIKNYIQGNISIGKFCNLINKKRHEIQGYLEEKEIFDINATKQKYHTLTC
ncbi:MAG: ImmA/IrrE family metallo-endopeptidase [Candidatus Margulisbacteria bacterium]|nr:ImmA/IrrE family metallo-endopeptidase [Candidatus Margulisiibacteriota bacterium]